MLKKLVCLLLFSIGIAAAQNTTTLSGTIKTQDGSAFNGSMKISIGKSVLDTCTSPPHLVGNIQTVVAIVAGVPDNTKTFITTQCLSGVPYFVQFFDSKNTDILDANWYLLPEGNTGATNIGDMVLSKFGGPIVVSVPTPIIATPATNQIITQPTGTTFSVNNLVVTNTLLFSGSLNLTGLTVTNLTATNITATHITTSDVTASVSIAAPAVSGTSSGTFGGLLAVGQGSSTPDANAQFAEVNPANWTAWSIKTAGVTTEGRLGHDVNGSAFVENMRWDGTQWVVDDNTVLGSMVMVRPDTGVLVRVYPAGNTTTPFEWNFTPAGTLIGPGGTVIGGTPIANIQISTGTTAISAHACTTNTATNMPGLLTTSALSTPTPTSDTSAVNGWGSTSGLGFIFYVQADTLNWRVCNATGSSITPGASITWNIGAK